MPIQKPSRASRASNKHKVSNKKTKSSSISKSKSKSNRFNPRSYLPTKELSKHIAANTEKEAKNSAQLKLQNELNLKLINANCGLFTIGRMKSNLVCRQSKFNVFRLAYIFLLVFNATFFFNSFFSSLYFILSNEFKVMQINQSILYILIVFSVLRILHSFYGVFAVTCAVNRMPLCFLMLYTFFVCIMFSAVGTYTILTDHMVRQFVAAIKSYDPTMIQVGWSWLEGTQQNNQCCGLHSWKDYVSRLQLVTENLLPKSCCQSKKCTTKSVDIHQQGCEKFVHIQQQYYIVNPLTFLIVMDTLTVALSLYMMRTFRYRYQKVLVTENESSFLKREEKRLLDAVIKAKLILAREAHIVSEQFNNIIRAEKAKSLRKTMEGLPIAIQRMQDSSILVTQLKHDTIDRVEGTSHSTIQPMPDQALIGIISNQVNEEYHRKMAATAAAKLKMQSDDSSGTDVSTQMSLNPAPWKTIDSDEKKMPDTPSLKVWTSTEKLMSNLKESQSEAPAKESGAKANVIPAMSRVKSSSYLFVSGGVMTPFEECKLPVAIRQAPRTRNANLEIAKRMQNIRELKELGEKIEFVRTNSIDLRVDKISMIYLTKTLTSRSIFLPEEAKIVRDKEKRKEKKAKIKKSNVIQKFFGQHHHEEEENQLSYDLYSVWSDISL